MVSATSQNSYSKWSSLQSPLRSLSSATGILSPRNTTNNSSNSNNNGGGNVTPRRGSGNEPFKHKFTLDTREESDVVKVQNSALDLNCDDLTCLPLLHEPAILESLRIRYESDCIYTSIGSVLIAVNPFKKLDLYDDKAVDRYKLDGERPNNTSNVEKNSTGQERREKKLPPHIFKTTDVSYRNILTGLSEGCVRDQSILISGESGSGKTWTSKVAMKYLAVLSCQRSMKSGRVEETPSKESSKESSMEQQVLLSNPILEAFGNARTIRNDNSSRFGKFIEIGFDSGGVLSGAKIETYLLEKSRVISQAKGERNYHIFYQLLSGSTTSTLTSLNLNSCTPSDFTITNDIARRDDVMDNEAFEETEEAFGKLKFKEGVVRGIKECIAAVLHLGNVTFTR